MGAREWLQQRCTIVSWPWWSSWCTCTRTCSSRCCSLFPVRSGSSWCWRRPMQASLSTLIPDICHKHHKRCLWRKNLSCGEIFIYYRLLCGEVSPHEKCEENLSHRGSSPHDKCGAKCVMWRNLSCGDWRTVSTWQISPHEQWEIWSKSVLWRDFSTWPFFSAIYSVLSRNLFCRNLRAFVWRKIEPKIVLVEKKRQISGMSTLSTWLGHTVCGAVSCCKSCFRLL